MKTRLARLLLLAGFAAGAACSSTSSTAPVDYTGSCGRLASRCHSGSSAIAKQCHELGHDGDDAKCGPREAECLADCPDGGDDHDASPGDAGGGDAADAADSAASPACTALCTCVETTCSAVTNYPFSAPGSCLAACAAYSASERSCFQTFCEKAGDGGSKSHDCEHATGKLGSQECP